MNGRIWRVLVAWRWSPCLALSAGSLLFALGVAALVPEQLELLATSTARIGARSGSEPSSLDADRAPPATRARPSEADRPPSGIPFEPPETLNPAPAALPEPPPPPPPVPTPEPPAEPPPVATPEPPPAPPPPPEPSSALTQNQPCLDACQAAFQSCMAPTTGVLANIADCQERLASCREGCG